MAMNEKQVPYAWATGKLGETIKVIRGVSFPKEAKHNLFEPGLIACLRTTNVQRQVVWDDLWYVSDDYVKRNDQLIREWDILISTANSLELLGKVAQVKKVPCKSTLGTFIVNLRVPNDIDSKFVYYYLSSKKFQADVQDRASTTTNISNISTGKLKEIDIPVAPLLEQRRIVSKIEELFSELDQSVDLLKTIQKQLKVYRQAVLKSAFEGKLTEGWRNRQASFSNQFSKKVKLENNNSKNLGLEEPQIAATWQWVKLKDISDKIFDGPFGSNLKTSDYTHDGIRVIRLENIGSLIFKDELHSYVSEEKYESIKKHTVTAGDIIFSSFISDQIRVTILPSSIDRAINKADCFCIRINSKIALNTYIAFFLSTRFTYNQLVNEIHGATRPRINTTQLKECYIPICPFEEQSIIVEKIASRMSVADKLEENIGQILQQAEAFRQGILKKAFEGRLLSDDELAELRNEADWEPASVLLERIKAPKPSSDSPKETTRKGTKNYA